MTVSRRRFLSGCAALPLVTGWGAPTMASMTAGNGMLTTLSDGHLTLPGDFIFGPMPQEPLAPLLARLGVSRDAPRPECNVTLYRDDLRTVLFDVGAGPDFQASAGQLPDALAAAGITADEVTHVVFTHAHPDHIWGLLDDFDDPTFANASYLIGRDEWTYWTDPATVNTIEPARTAFAVGAKRRLETVAEAVQLFDPGHEILPGIEAIASPGHTPGHSSFVIGGKAMVLGDAIGNHHAAFRHPEWPSGSDQDRQTAIATRHALFDRILADNLAITGFHLPGGGMGRVERFADGFHFIEGET